MDKKVSLITKTCYHVIESQLYSAMKTKLPYLQLDAFRDLIIDMDLESAPMPPCPFSVVYPVCFWDNEWHEIFDDWYKILDSILLDAGFRKGDEIFIDIYS